MKRLKALSEMIFRRWSVRSWFIPSSIRRYQNAVGDGTTSSTVMAPLLWIARNFPEAPPAIWKLLDDGEEEQDTGHDLIRLLARPNPYYSGAILWMATLTDWHVTGNAYWLKIRSRAGVVRELWWTPSTLIEPKQPGEDTTEYLNGYTYRPGDGQEIPLEPGDVVHFRYGLDSEDVRLGKSPLSSVLREVFTDTEAADFTATLLGNMGVPGLIVSPDGDQAPSKEDADATKDYVKEEFGGEGRGRPLVMSGKTKVSQFGFSPEQLDLRALRRVPEERTTGCIGIPAIVCGLGAGLDRSTFANYAEAREAAFEDNIIPSQRILSEDIRFQLLTDFEDDPWAWRVGFDLSNVRVLQEDENKLAQRGGQLFKDGVISRAEARRDLGYEANDSDEVYAVPFSVVLTPTDGALEAPPPPNEPPEEEPEEEPETRARKARNPQQALVLAFDRDARLLQAVFAEELETDFAALGDLCAEALTDRVSPEALRARSNGHRKASDEQIAGQIMGAVGLTEWNREHLKRRFEVHYQRTAEQTVDTINAVLDLGVSLPDPAALRIITEGGTRRGLVDLDRTTRSALMRAISEGREAGEGPIEIARRIRSEVPAGRYANAGAKYRAELISRTETKWAQNLSSVETYKAADNVTAVLAFDARLGESDPDCEARDGMTFTFEQAEAEMAMEHPNGTLSFAPVVGEPQRVGA